jgi:hypothetical protein
MTISPAVGAAEIVNVRFADVPPPGAGVNTSPTPLRGRRVGGRTAEREWR